MLPFRASSRPIQFLHSSGQFYQGIIIEFTLARSVLLERRQKEDEILQEVQATVMEGRVEIKKLFEVMTKDFTEGVQRKQKEMELQYVSPNHPWGNRLLNVNLILFHSGSVL